MNYTATYSPEDNKLRLYASARLDAETYQRVKAAGFIWAPKQELFVAPMWTPEREDLLLELCGEIDDEDKSLVDRAEERAGRFDQYSDNRLNDANRAREAVSAIADNIPLGQPILVGHHSERHARKDAERIENGMRKAVKMWRQSEYWTQRAKGAISHAKYKERPDVRARRIKGLEADKRKQERIKAEAEKWLRLWSKEGLTLEDAKKIANFCWLHLPKKEGDDPNWNQNPSAYDTLGESRYKFYAPRTVEEVVEAAKIQYPATIERCNRWLEHYENRLTYERAMLAESGGTVADRTGPEVGGGCRCWASPRGGWSYIQKVNKVSVTVLDNWGNGGGNFTRTIPFDKLKGMMTKAEVEAKRAAGELIESQDKTGFFISADKPTQTVNPSAHGANIEAGLKHAEKKPEIDEDAFQKMAEQVKQGVKVVVANQLFPTPPDIAERMVEYADVKSGQRILEPSAGTGAILEALQGWPLDYMGGLTIVEVNQSLCDALRLKGYQVHQADFLTCNGDLGAFDRILMNPPFENGDDIKHIKHALTFLKPGGRLVAICANGPRQNEQLKPLASEWEELPAGTFEGTNVNAALLVIDKKAAA